VLHFSVVSSHDSCNGRVRFESCGGHLSACLRKQHVRSALRVREMLQGSDSAEDSPHRMAALDCTVEALGIRLG
jgi:hypothetical protein